MFISSANPVYAYALLNALLAALLTRPAAALMDAIKVHLYTAGPSPILPSMTIASFTEATFTGYAAATITTLSGPINTPSGSCDALFNNASFVAGSGLTSGQTCLGYWVDDGATNIYMGEAFANPVPIAHPGDFIDLAVIFGLAYSPIY